MNRDLTELVFILDRSGSMRGLESDTVGGFNSMIDRQKKADGQCLVSTVLFDDRTEVVHDRVPLDRIRPLTDREYYVRGCTALLDAVGGAIHHIANVHKYAREEDRPAKTIFVITTDGLENASHRYSYAAVSRLVQHEKEKYNWEFIFLGANIDAVAEAGRLGIAPERAVRYECDGEGTRLNYAVVGEALHRYRMDASVSAKIDDDWMEEIRKDYACRHKE